MKEKHNKTYTVEEAMEKFKVTRQVIYKYKKQGKLTGKKIGPMRKWYLTESSVERLYQKMYPKV